MIRYPDVHDTPVQSRHLGLANLISTALALSFGISMAVAALLVAAGALLEP